MMTSADTASWVTTLIQIGIPSLVTLASLCVTFRLGKASNQKDIAIANIVSDSEKQKMTSERKANLITDIVVVLTEVENAHSAYSGLFRRTKIEDVSTTIAPSKELQDSFSTLSSVIDRCCGVRTAINLLGNSLIIGQFDLYLEANFRFQLQANPDHGSASLIDLSHLRDELNFRQKKLFELLSDQYLDSPPQKSEP